MLDPSGEGLNSTRRRHCIGDSDARIIMGDDEAALLLYCGPVLRHPAALV